MTIFVLLKGKGTNGRVTFHGVAVTDDGKAAWENSGRHHWTYAFTPDEGSLFATKPITDVAVEEGSVEKI